jgi:hypothetical protein
MEANLATKMAVRKEFYWVGPLAFQLAASMVQSTARWKAEKWEQKWADQMADLLVVQRASSRAR